MNRCFATRSFTCLNASLCEYFVYGIFFFFEQWNIKYLIEQHLGLASFPHFGGN